MIVTNNANVAIFLLGQKDKEDKGNKENLSDGLEHLFITSKTLILQQPLYIRKLPPPLSVHALLLSVYQVHL
jgi:hypothetical protein